MISTSSMAALRAAPIEPIVRSFGLIPNRAGFCKCPFHSGGNERTPSLRLYENNYHCFSCNAHGDGIAFVRRLEGLSFTEAARRVDRICVLGLPLDRTETPQERRRAAQEAAERRRKEAEREEVERLEGALYELLAACLRIGNDALSRGPPWSEAEVLAVRRYSEIEDICDALDKPSQPLTREYIVGLAADYEAIIRTILESEEDQNEYGRDGDAGRDRREAGSDPSRSGYDRLEYGYTGKHALCPCDAG